MIEQKKLRVVLLVLMSLVVALLVYWNFSSRYAGTALGDLNARKFEVKYRWENGMRDFHIIDWRTGLPEKNVGIAHLIRNEGEEIVSQMLMNLQLRKASGTFVVRVIGVGEPYVVELLEWREPIDPDFTPLMRAAKKGDYEAVRRLLAEGADVEQSDQKGRTAVMLAAGSGNVKVIKALLEAGAKPNRLGPRGWTALFVAVVNGKTDCVRALLAGGADVNVQDQTGQTPLQYARERGFKGIVEILIGHGATE